MKTAKRLLPQWFLLPAVLLGWLVSAAALSAQTVTGTVQGRVYNPVSKEYVANAEVRLEGTNQVVFTSDSGSFQFLNVPAGTATVSVLFTGYNTAKETLTVTAGQTAVREINITSTAASEGGGKDASGVVKLEAFTVASQREGNSKAIMAQRKDMNIITATSSDIFGDVTDGNVGEFLKYLPGVDLDYVESEPRGPRLGGMDGQYVGVAFDGQRTASADANRGGGSNSRATSFEGFSITSIDSIEINRTASPENDADSPAGTINMKTKRAFDRKGRRFDYNVGVNFNSDEFRLGNAIHPGEKAQYQWKPNWQFTYAESFLDQKFGILLGANRGWSLTEQTTESMTYNVTPTATDSRPMVVQQIDYKDGPKWIQKDALLLTADWKVTPRLVLSLNLVYSYFSGDFWNRDFVFTAGNNNTNVNNGRQNIGGDGITTYIGTQTATNTVPGVNWAGGGADKKTWTRQYTPRFEYKFGGLTVDGAIAFSKSKNRYDGLATGFSTAAVGGVPASFTATRPNAQSWEWTIKQTSGNDWFNIKNFGQPTTGTNTQLAGTSAQDRTEDWTTAKWTETLNARYALPFMEKFPTVIKVGGKVDDEDRINHNWNGVAKYVYTGPGGNTVAFNPATGTYSITSIGNWGNLGPDFVSPNQFRNYSSNSFNIYNVNGAGGVPPFPAFHAIADLYHAHPELFVNTGNVNDYYNSFIANERRLSQRISAGYLQSDTRLTAKLSIRYGVRVEKTGTTVTEFDPLTPIQMLSSPFASQFTKNPTTGLVSPSNATSVAGIFYQYTTKPKVKRSSDYTNYFPSLLMKYNFLPNLEWQAGINKGISRPPVDNLTGLWVVNDNASPPTVTAPNPNLLPERHVTAQSRLAYYFGGQSPGQLSVAVIQDEATNFISNRTYDSGAPLGVTDPNYDGYQFISTQNDPGVHRYRNFDFNYNQTLGFLRSEYLRGINMGVTYSRSYDNQRHVNLVPRRWTFTPSYTYKRFNAGLGIIFTAAKPSSLTYGEYYGAMTKIDVRASYRFNNYLSLYTQIRNITNVKDEFYKSAPNVPEGQNAALRVMEQYGANWVFGMKGSF
jgi:TonB-dependent receptor